MRPSAILTYAVLACGTLYPAMSALGMAPEPDAADASSTQFAVSEQTQIPGITLRPGTYSIRILDHLADRMIVQVEGASGTVHQTFIGLPGGGLPKRAATGSIPYSSGTSGKGALRGFMFPGGTAVEFVYPKAEAVALAQANAEKVPAIDPESEGRAAAPDLSKGDMQLVTLWMLSTTKVAPGQSGPGVKAEKYQQASSVRPRPLMAALPHTAGSMPLCAGTALLALGGAALLGYRRQREQ